MYKAAVLLYNGNKSMDSLASQQPHKPTLASEFTTSPDCLLLGTLSFIGPLPPGRKNAITDKIAIGIILGGVSGSRDGTGA